MTQIFGHSSLRTTLTHQIRHRTLAQANVFYGVEGIGKKLVALEAAAQILCQRPLQESIFSAACGKCEACVRFQQNVHPDFYRIEPTLPKSQTAENKKSQSRGTIRVEQIQELKERLAYPALMGESRVVIIDQAELMSVVTANSLLKILEEPRPNLYFILLTNHFGRLLVTIRSRVMRYYFSPLSGEETKAVLQANFAEIFENVDPKFLDFVMQAFLGSPGNIAAALQSGAVLEKIDAALAAKKSFSAVSDLVHDLMTWELPHLTLQLLRQRYLDQVKQSPQEGWRPLDFFDKLRRAEADLAVNVPAEAVFERVFL